MKRIWQGNYIGLFFIRNVTEAKKYSLPLCCSSEHYLQKKKCLKLIEIAKSQRSIYEAQRTAHHKNGLFVCAVYTRCLAIPISLHGQQPTSFLH